MNIKSLLIGSAAAIVAVSGARAADAVVIAEPEPFEYVRVCDTYGVGFYYIPGTETCLRISGLIRYDIEFSEDNEYELSEDDVDNLVDNLREEFDLEEDEAFANLDAAERFELAAALGLVGPGLDIDDLDDLEDLRDAINDISVDAEGNVVVTQDGLDEGWVKDATARLNIDARSETEWGTFRRFIRLEANTGGSTGAFEGIYGLDESDDVTLTFAYVELGGLLVGLYDTLWDGEMSPEFDVGGGSAAHQIRYTFSGANGMTFALSIEEHDYNYDYTPNVVGRVGLSQGWGSVALFAAYDATFEEFGLKGIARFDITDAIWLEGMAIYESGFGDFSVASQNGMVGYEFSLAASLAFKATDQLTFWVGGQYFGDQHWFGHDNYAVATQVDWVPVENLILRGRLEYNGGDSQDFIDGQIRLQASF
jgi:hypothetical protein